MVRLRFPPVPFDHLDYLHIEHRLGEVVATAHDNEDPSNVQPVVGFLFHLVRQGPFKILRYVVRNVDRHFVIHQTRFNATVFRYKLHQRFQRNFSFVELYQRSPLVEEHDGR